MGDKKTTAQKLVELHEKLNDLDKERDELKAKLSKHSTWWKNPAMLTALTGLLALLATSAENCRQQRAQLVERTQESTINKTTHRTAYKFILDRQNEFEDKMQVYMEVMASTLSPVQRQQINRKLKELEMDQLSSAPALPVIEELAIVPSVATAEIPEPSNLYDAIQMQVKDSGAVDLQQLEKSFAPRAK